MHIIIVFNENREMGGRRYRQRQGNRDEIRQDKGQTATVTEVHKLNKTLEGQNIELL